MNNDFEYKKNKLPWYSCVHYNVPVSWTKINPRFMIDYYFISRLTLFLELNGETAVLGGCD